ncbi:inorganic diphosphatase [Candidatus Bipolaricaulota bacterium]|nr:inorganic diphosphatase [Candidatus Bipolaricaulota bacterium]
MDHVHAFVEVPKGSRNKYELDEKLRLIRLDRVLYSPLHYPADYGFILNTLAEDGDALDVLIITYEPTFPGCVVPVRPVGVLDMEDEHGRDQKIIAVPVVDPRFDDVHDLEGLPRHLLLEIEHFFMVYKALEKKPTEILGWMGSEEAWRLIRLAQERYSLAGKPFAEGPGGIREGNARPF